jgi:arylformamidase
MRSFKAAVLFLSLCAGTCASFAADAPEQPTPTKSDVPYGADARNVLDFWDASGDGPRPLLIYIHGGGWLTGDKSKKGPTFQPFLDRGISIAAINYRLPPENPLPAPIHDAVSSFEGKSMEHRYQAHRFDRAKCGGVHSDVAAVAR